MTLGSLNKRIENMYIHTYDKYNRNYLEKFHKFFTKSITIYSLHIL